MSRRAVHATKIYREKISWRDHGYGPGHIYTYMYLLVPKEDTILIIEFFAQF